MTSVISIIKDSLVVYDDKLEQSTIDYLTGVISESESEDELKEQVTSALTDFEVVTDTNELGGVVDDLVALLRKKGALSFSSAPKVKSHLVCEINPSAEPKITDPNLTMEDYLQLTRSADPKIRVKALRTMCPCKVKADKELLWNRIMEMSTDPDPRVRYQVVHDLCDGSPQWREDAVISTLESMHDDTDPKIRRTVHKILTHYKYTGKWNIL